MSIKRALRDWFPEDLRYRLRRLSRLRWVTKYKVLRSNGVTVSDRPIAALKYVLLDPEVDTFTYAVDNVHELAGVLADLIDDEPERVAGFIAETKSDPELTERLRRRVRWRFDSKNRLELPAHHLSAWVLVRALRPVHVVETGVLDGLGSLVMLRALERNNNGGRLTSFDLMPGAGWIVPKRLRPMWTFVVGSTIDHLEPVLERRPADLFVHDSDPSQDHQRFEFTAALRHAAAPIALLTPDDWGPALKETVEGEGGRYRRFLETPRGHFYRGIELGLGFRAGAIYDRPGVRGD